MATINEYREGMAQALVKNCMDVVAAWRVVYPPDGYGSLNSLKTSAAIKRKFAEIYGGDATLWRRVAELQKIADQHIALTAADVVKFWETAATVDRREISQIVQAACNACGGNGCAACYGTGIASQTVRMAATASYSPGAAAIYEGAEMGPHGVKVHTVSKSKAWEMLARHHGLMNEKLLLARQDKLPAEVPTLPDDPQEASRAYSDLVKGL